MARRRLASVVMIGGISVISLFLLQIAAARLPFPGLKSFVNFTVGDAH